MFTVNEVDYPSDLVCTDPVQDHQFDENDFHYFDKDGFELNKAEQLFYHAAGHDINTGYLNKPAWMSLWIALDEPEKKSRIFIDHAFCTYRCNYRGQAAEQIKEQVRMYPEAHQLLQIRPKWGFDIDINAIAEDGTVFEVLHVEYDTYFYKQFNTQRQIVEDQLMSIDWNSAADEVWDRRLEWSKLTGYKQNDWKANLLLGWKYSEYIKKAIKI